MAEVVGIAASVAGLASLSIEIFKGVKAVKELVAATRDLQERVRRIERTLTILECLRHRLAAKQVAPFATDGDEFLLQACLDDYTAVARALTSLQERMAVTRRRRRILRGISDATLVHELNAIDTLTAQALQKFTL